MTTPKELIPQRYEVIKLKSGTEVVGMTRDCGDVLEITLPMICQLSLVPGTPRTNAVFYPYAPLSADEVVSIPKFEIVHRNIMNEQFVPYYDDASSRWFEMIENKSNIELLAIGIGHDVTRYYDKAVKITDVQDLGDVMINQLTDLFVKNNKKTLH